MKDGSRALHYEHLCSFIVWDILLKGKSSVTHLSFCLASTTAGGHLVDARRGSWLRFRGRGRALRFSTSPTATTMSPPTGLITRQSTTTRRADGARCGACAQRRNTEHHGRGWKHHRGRHSHRRRPSDRDPVAPDVDPPAPPTYGGTGTLNWTGGNILGTRHSVGPRLNVGQRDNANNTNYTGIVNHSGGKISLNTTSSAS